ncbi:hypothetical protein HMF7854_12020 [Sphingomonas ginkgonis]|uniref:Uncharacterized protein n=1 Tax=Sphingomonas ginkgonis TaxID=2315330 RepID=A0A429VC79_9SPHN|nr:hypothetical protein [Sphingomonas ginkgonis]RST31486.1 hypothetical protein HMF7854_12020 [Sphingomonas ginkgonis]
MIPLLLTIAAQAVTSPTTFAATDWQSAPVASGSWTYRRLPTGSEAAFGAPAAPMLVVRCDLASRSVSLVIGAAPPGTPVTLLTTSRTQASADGRFAARDPILDAMVFSRGRFAVAANGGNSLVFPAWPEPARSIEDCRI